jgi:PST family polysaccharide transporter
MQLVANTASWLFISSGQAGQMMRWGIFSSLISIASFLAGLPWGAEGVARAYFVSQALCIPVLYWYCCRNSPVSQIALYMLQAPMIVGGVISFLLSRALPATIEGIWYVLAVVAISYACCWLAELCFPEGRRSVSEYLEMLRKATRSQAASG